MKLTVAGIKIKVTQAIEDHLHKKIEKLMNEFNELAHQDSSLPFDERLGCSLVGAIRPWEFSLFAQYRK